MQLDQQVPRSFGRNGSRDLNVNAGALKWSSVDSEYILAADTDLLRVHLCREAADCGGGWGQGRVCLACVGASGEAKSPGKRGQNPEHLSGTSLAFWEMEPGGVQGSLGHRMADCWGVGLCEPEGLGGFRNQGSWVKF